MKEEKKDGNKKLDEAKKVVRSLLLSTKHGLTVNELCSEYKIMTCEELPFRQLGYYSPVDLIRAMRDVVHTSFQPGGAMLLRGIADESTAHIRDLVRGQKSTRYNTKLSKPKEAPKRRPKRPVSHFIQSKIYDLMMNYPDGLEFRLFENAYMRKYDKKINPQLQGFTSIRGLLEACTDIISVETKKGVLFLYPVKTSGARNRYSLKTVPYMPLTTKFLDENKVINIPNVKTKPQIPQEIKMQIFTVLEKRANGIFAARFPFDFKAAHKQEFDFQSLGYGSVVEMMSDIPEIVSVTRPTEKGDFVLTLTNPKQPIVPEEKPKNVDYLTSSPGNVNDKIEICVSYIVDPSLFWIQISTGLSELYELMDEMTNFYHFDAGTKYQLPPQSVVPGQACAAIFEDDQWYRAVVQEVLSDNEVNVYYVDYGNEFDIEITSLCILKEEYTKLPCQAFKAKLSGVEPCGDNYEKGVIENFYDLTCDQHLYANIVEKEPVLCLDIMDNENNHVSDMLNEEPEFLPSDEETVIEDENVCNKSKYIDDTENTLKSLPNKLMPSQVDSDLEVESDLTEVNSNLVKCLRISTSCTLHILRYEEAPYVLSSEISALFWETDVLRQMLHQKGCHDIKSTYLLLREHRELFSALENYHIQGTVDGKVKDILSIYELTSLPKIYSCFEPIYKNTKAVILREIKLWSETIYDEQYWCPTKTGGSYDEKQSSEAMLKLQARFFMKKRLYQLIFINEHLASDD